MSFFGAPRPKGIDPWEWEKRDRSKVRGVFGTSAQGKRKADIVETALSQGLDTDSNTRGRPVMQAEEVEASLQSLEGKHLIGRDDAAKVRKALDKDLRD